MRCDTELHLNVQARNIGEEHSGHLPPKILKHCIAILPFAETFKILYSNSENFRKCSVCVRIAFGSCLSS